MERLYIELADGREIAIFVRHIIAVMPAGDGTDIVTGVGTYYSRQSFRTIDAKLKDIMNLSVSRGVA